MSCRVEAGVVEASPMMVREGGGVPTPFCDAMVKGKGRGNCTQKPTAKNIALELGSNAEK